jgi:hypothetical protein
LVLLALAMPVWAQYAGPAILSRGEAPAAMTVPSVDFAFSVALTAGYSNGLAGLQTANAQGKLPSLSSDSVGLTFGVSGAHSWRHTRLGLNYSGGITDYFSAQHFNGISQGLAMSLTHQFSRHVSFSAYESAGWFTYFPPATVALNSSVSYDPSQTNIPTTDFYDNRTIYSSSGASLILQATSRLSFGFGGGYLTDFRSNAGLYSATGESASGDVQYRLSRRTTIGGGYGFSHYAYSHSFGGAFVHSASLSFSLRASRWTEFSAFGGAATVSSSFEQTVPINPAILSILCPPTLVSTCPLTAATVINNNHLWAPTFGIRFSRSFQRGVFSLSAGEAITPGNGLFLTSRAATASASYGYSGLHKWSLGIGVNYTTALSLGNINGGYGQVTGYYGMSRQLFGKLSFVSGFNATHYFSNSFAGYDRLIYSASAGFGYSSRTIPIRFF